MSTLILHNSVIINTSKLFQHIMRLKRLGVSMRIILPSLSKSSNMKTKLAYLVLLIMIILVIDHKALSEQCVLPGAASGTRTLST